MGSHMSQTEENQPLQNSLNKKNRGTPALPLGAQWAPKFVCMHPRGSLPQQPIKGQNWPNPLEPRIWTTPEVTVKSNLKKNRKRRWLLFLWLRTSSTLVLHAKVINPGSYERDAIVLTTGLRWWKWPPLNITFYFELCYTWAHTLF